MCCTRRVAPSKEGESGTRFRRFYDAVLLGVSAFVKCKQTLRCSCMASWKDGIDSVAFVDENGKINYQALLRPL